MSSSLHVLNRLKDFLGFWLRLLQHAGDAGILKSPAFDLLYTLAIFLPVVSNSAFSLNIFSVLHGNPDDDVMMSDESSQIPMHVYLPSPTCQTAHFLSNIVPLFLLPTRLPRWSLSLRVSKVNQGFKHVYTLSRVFCYFRFSMCLKSSGSQSAQMLPLGLIVSPFCRPEALDE